jgi:murein DD-endopeptidase
LVRFESTTKAPNHLEFVVSWCLGALVVKGFPAKMKHAILNGYGFCRSRVGVLGLALFVLLLGGCTASKGYPPVVTSSMEAVALIQTARGQLGVCYHPGGNSPSTGFDCSGFTQWVFQQRGLSLPRQSYDQYRIGHEVKGEELQQGDLVFFQIEKKGASHVGIYLDRGWFIHCSSPGGGVREDNLTDRYWQRGYLGARRILP